MPVSSLLSAEVLRYELAIQHDLASHLLRQASDAYAATDFSETDRATSAYDETQAKIADLEGQMPIAMGREAFLGRLAQRRPSLEAVTVASVAFNGNTRHRRIERVNLADHR